ncbi:Phosphoribosylformylglycinamidine synthase [Methanococcus vannielii SB]|jgi:phosphoribosylformylglycinamidine synthase|uniref:Phosphoribosylformylglycinamidine synthase subunit PurL n=1 Tax=Methanococcus vannielii (strain ATCC 35089 / DSM 1224 / JCM 13029 / OCM 148 / SB) TaxID=406327 RepID=A6URF9_METVS|nr:AIR synthase-related protein [Methanococcus vannielii]ABR55081.1 Phosphoribosylformylglycinamidine synthase [Methanococcus vannielii SB]
MQIESTKKGQKTFRIAIDTKEKSSEAVNIEKKLLGLGYNVSIDVSRIYTLDYDFSSEEIQMIANSLYNPVIEFSRVNTPFNKKFDFALELGFLPGVTDNVANTTTEIINDLLKIDIGLSKVFSSKTVYITGNLKKLTYEDVEKLAKELINVLIERYHIKTYDEYVKNNGMEFIVPKVHLTAKPKVIEVNLNVSDEELIEIGKKGILDPDTLERRGPLALDIEYLTAIKDYFKKEGRNPNDIEIEAIAQTWSEHCKHTIFASEIDEDVKEGIFKKYIRNATNEIRKELGERDFCISVFSDNSGGIIFDENWMVTDKAETHNSPSALDPFGGAITGIVGVNRDTMGFGLGALPIANKYGFCVGRPEDRNIVYRGKNKSNPALLPKKILEGVVHGVNVGGNHSGIPTPTGFVYFDDSYKGKPLVFVGTIGLIPRKLPNGALSHEKQAQKGDNIVVIGGRVGKDGIHGATFSSEAMDEGSPATAVQIGDPITQKKASDAIIKEARDLGLYNSITDNGAGGISCSVAEMAKECGGFVVELEKVPLKYPGLEPWEIWISESQERITLSVPDEKLNEFMELMKIRGVESVVIGKFNETDRAVVKYNNKTIMDLDMEFLHEGLPKKKLHTIPYLYNKEEPEINIINHLEIFEKILGNHNNCSFEYISKQYDHEVQNNSVVKPLQGIGRVNGTASVIKPVLTSKKGLVMSQSLYPRLSEINCYDMAACAIDTAIRNCVAVGGNINHLAIMDNFCWCSSDEPERLFQLKETARACYDYAKIYLTPFISGKDSMFNDFKGFDENNNPIKISALPTLMISALSVIDDVENTNTMEFKLVGDSIYIIGKTYDECGGSEFYHAFSKLGSKSPKVDAKYARKLYERIYELSNNKILSSCASVTLGGILITLSKMAIAGKLGAVIDSAVIPNESLSLEKILYSETQSRFIVTVAPENEKEFEKLMEEFEIQKIGKVTEKDFVVKHKNEIIINTSLERMEEVYKKRFKDF